MQFRSISCEFIGLKEILSLSCIVLAMFILFIFIVVVSNKLFNVVLNINLVDTVST